MLNTRAPSGLSGWGKRRGTFILDTRSYAASGLVISGPASVASGSQKDFHVLMNSVGGPTDVTSLSTIGIVGARPSYLSLARATLFVNRDAPATVIYLQAVYRNAAAQVVSPPFAVAISHGFFAKLLTEGETAARPH